ncbi:MAG: hypothetical protein ACN6RK_05975, partial [Stenotrophomonas sp.]
GDLSLEGFLQALLCGNGALQLQSNRKEHSDNAVLFLFERAIVTCDSTLQAIAWRPSVCGSGVNREACTTEAAKPYVI